MSEGSVRSSGDSARFGDPVRAHAAGMREQPMRGNFLPGAGRWYYEIGVVVQEQSHQGAKMSRTTILDAVAQALPRDGVPRSAAEIHKIILDKSLFTFRAQDPVSILRSAIRKHLATHGGPGQPVARVRQVERDRYVLV